MKTWMMVGVLMVLPSAAWAGQGDPSPGGGTPQGPNWGEGGSDIGGPSVSCPVGEVAVGNGCFELPDDFPSEAGGGDAGPGPTPSSGTGGDGRSGAEQAVRCGAKVGRAGLAWGSCVTLTGGAWLTGGILGVSAGIACITAGIATGDAVIGCLD